MRLLLLAVVLVACVSATAPRPYCVAKGDTTGLGPLYQSKDSVIVACLFLTEPAGRCFDTPPHRFTARDCVVGDKWKG
ncbi:MAG: hypothetical protein ACR652_24700 [Methylocystis sp.]|uniref:hypothetical protein n=1 Tax=Methylocystis sp. TaxID=1911079 RepID=UPI003DA5D141